MRGEPTAASYAERIDGFEASVLNTEAEMNARDTAINNAGNANIPRTFPTMDGWAIVRQLFSGVDYDLFPSHQYSDFDYLPNGEMFFANSLGISLLRNCHACREDQVSPGGSSGVESCVCKPNTFESGGICIACTSCGIGYYSISPCTQTSDAVCGICNVCSVGNYMKIACGVIDENGSRNGRCARCDPCEIGSYATIPCSGSNPSPVCSTCKRCLTDQYVTSWMFCDGTYAYEGEASCSSCRISGCRDGQYIGGRCDGDTTSDTTVCMECPRCPMGEYYSSGCDGSTYDTQHTCTRCSTCQLGEFISGGGCKDAQFECCTTIYMQ